MKRNAKRVFAMALVVVLVLGIAGSAISALVYSAAPRWHAKANIEHLMEAGFSKEKAEAVADVLVELGSGELTGISVDDTGSDYEVVFYTDACSWSAIVDYQGNLVGIMEDVYDDVYDDTYTGCWE